MTADTTFDLIRRSQNGESSATEQLVAVNSGLIWSVVRRFFGRGVESDDLYQLGCLGFLKAVSGFDESFGTQFSTYAVPKISGEIRRFLRDDGAVKVSRSVKELALQIRTARSELEQSLGREPTVSELSEHLGIPAEEIAMTETATGPAESLQRENGEEGLKLEDVLGDYGQEERLIERYSLDEAIGQLSEKEQMVVSLRFFHGLTQQKSAQIMGVSQVQVSRLERKAISELKYLLASAD